jgi:hypothetical protein
MINHDVTLMSRDKCMNIMMVEFLLTAENTKSAEENNLPIQNKNLLFWSIQVQYWNGNTI